MQACNECHVHVETGGEFCPLCGTRLEETPDRPADPVPNAYPDLSRSMAQYNFVWRLFAFLTFFGCGFSVLINLLLNPRFLWCLIVIAAAVYSWATVPRLLARGANSAKKIVLTVLITALLVVALDLIIGYRGWSVDYVVPSLLITGILASWAMVMFNRTRWAQYVLYQVIVGIFGFVPLLLYLLGIGGNLVLVLVAAGLALASILITVTFGDRSIKNEFIKRFHV